MNSAAYGEIGFQDKTSVFSSFVSTPISNKLVAENLLLKCRQQFQSEEDILIINSIADQESFQENPNVYVTNMIIDRGAGRACTEDHIRCYLIANLQGLGSMLESPEFLKSVAEVRFASLDNKAAVMQAFEQLLQDKFFQSDLFQAITELNRCILLGYCSEQENQLRAVLNIFNLAQSLNPVYELSGSVAMEKACAVPDSFVSRFQGIEEEENSTQKFNPMMMSNYFQKV